MIITDWDKCPPSMRHMFEFDEHGNYLGAKSDGVEKTLSVADKVLDTHLSERARQERAEADARGLPQYAANTRGRPAFTPGAQAAIVASGLTGKGQLAAGAFVAGSAMTMPGKTFGGGVNGTPVTKGNPAFAPVIKRDWPLMAIPPVLGILWAAWADAGPLVNIGMPLLGILLSFVAFYITYRTNRKEVQMLCGLWTASAGVADIVFGQDKPQSATGGVVTGAAAGAAGVASGGWRNPHGGSLNDDGTSPGGESPLQRQGLPRYVPADHYPVTPGRSGWRNGPQGQNMNDPKNWPSGYERPTWDPYSSGGYLYRYPDGTTYDVRYGR